MADPHVLDWVAGQCNSYSAKHKDLPFHGLTTGTYELVPDTRAPVGDPRWTAYFVGGATGVRELASKQALDQAIAVCEIHHAHTRRANAWLIHQRDNDPPGWVWP